MPFVTRNPFIALLVPFILGILLGQKVSISPTAIAFVSIALFTYLAIAIRQIEKTKVYLFSIAACLLASFIGLFLGSDKPAATKGPAFTGEKWIKATLLDLPSEKRKSYAVTLTLDAFKDRNEWIPCNEKIIAYIQKSVEVDQLKAGEQIIAQIKLQEIPPLQNPVGFNYAKYMTGKGIYCSAYIKNNDWKPLLLEQFNIKRFAVNIRKSLVDIYEQAGLQKENLAIFSALTIGYKNYLDPETKQVYSGSGAIHILAVSGMHVGIILSILHIIAYYILQLRRKSILYYSVLLIGIWLYALLSGLSPSITRATVMASFIIFGKLLYKHMNVYNSIAASAFFMLCYDPNYLFDLGFQLSYSALLGIIFFQKKFSTLIYIPFKPLRAFWELTTLAFSAQIGTLPLSIYYFNQLPAYFWLSGALVVIFAYLLMIAAFVLISVYFLGFETALLGTIIQYLSEYLNKFVFWIYQLPNSIVPFYQTTILQTIFLYICIACIVAFIILRNRLWFLSALSIALVILAINLSLILKSSRSQKLIAYQIPKETLIQYSKGRTSIWLCSNPEHYMVQQLIKQANSSFYLDANKQKVVQLNDDYSDETLGFSKKGDFICTMGEKIYLFQSKAQTVDNLPVNTSYGISSYSFNNTAAYNNDFKAIKNSNNQTILHSTKSDGAFILERNMQRKPLLSLLSKHRKE